MPRPLVIAILIALLAAAPATAAWRWPAAGDVRGGFAYSPRSPFAAGQRRGVDLAARPGSVVVAACGGQVSHAGPVPRRALGVSLRCGRMVATHLGLGRVVVRRGMRVRAGAAVGTVGADGLVRIGAREAAGRFAYVDPLALLDDGRAPRDGPGPLGAAPRDRARRRHAPVRSPRRRSPTARPASAGSGVHVIAWAGLALLVFAFPGGGLARRRRRARARLVPHPR